MSNPNPVNALSDIEARTPALQAQVRAWHARGITCSAAANKLVVRPYALLNDEDRAFIKAHRAHLKVLVKSGAFDDEPEAPVARPEPRPGAAAKQPVVDRREYFALGQRVTERDVEDALTSLGDEVLADYRAGRLSRDEAYTIAARRLTDASAIGRTQRHFR